LATFETHEILPRHQFKSTLISQKQNLRSGVVSMADLLPSLSSDEEGDVAEQTEDEGENEIDEGFEFGGILGEDGGDVGISSSSFAVENTGWSFRPDRGASERGLVPHMDLGDLIAAKRKAMLSSKAAAKKELLEQQTASKDDKTNKNSKVVETNEIKNDASSSSSSSDEDTSDEEEADENDDIAKKALEGDVLKHRAGKEEAEDDDDSSDDSGGSADDEEAAEQAKAAEYFENEETPVTDRTFTELALSRPLLRGIAAMGFVQPTPIQSSVIPLALQGRDVCASAQTGSGKVTSCTIHCLLSLVSILNPDSFSFVDGGISVANPGTITSSTEWPDQGIDFAPHARIGRPVHWHDGDVCQVYEYYFGLDYGWNQKHASTSGRIAHEARSHGGNSWTIVGPRNEFSRHHLGRY
jgi:DEAD/DEAH box helicase